MLIKYRQHDQNRQIPLHQVKTPLGCLWKVFFSYQLPTDDGKKLHKQVRAVFSRLRKRHNRQSSCQSWRTCKAKLLLFHAVPSSGNLNLNKHNVSIQRENVKAMDLQDLQVKWFDFVAKKLTLEKKFSERIDVAWLESAVHWRASCWICQGRFYCFWRQFHLIFLL